MYVPPEALKASQLYLCLKPLDNKRNTYNPADDSLFANLNDAEDVTTGDDIDFLSNGFKVREGGNSVGDNYTYIYMAFAENPFVTSTGVPATAR